LILLYSRGSRARGRSWSELWLYGRHSYTVVTLRFQQKSQAQVLSPPRPLFKGPISLKTPLTHFSSRSNLSARYPAFLNIFLNYKRRSPISNQPSPRLTPSVPNTRIQFFRNNSKHYHCGISRTMIHRFETCSSINPGRENWVERRNIPLILSLLTLTAPSCYLRLEARRNWRHSKIRVESQFQALIKNKVQSVSLEGALAKKGEESLSRTRRGVVLSAMLVTSTSPKTVL